MKVSQNPFQALEETPTPLDEPVQTIITDSEKDEKVDQDEKVDVKNEDKIEEKIEEKGEIDPVNEEKGENVENNQDEKDENQDEKDEKDNQDNASHVSDEKEDEDALYTTDETSDVTSDTSHTSDTSDAKDEDADQEEIDLVCTYVLANHSAYPLYVSDSRADLVDLRSRMVQEVVAEYSAIGRCYVRFDKDENEDICSISYMQRNLFWSTERTIDSYTIFRVPKI